MMKSAPYKIFSTWYEEAKKFEDSYPNAFTLATSTPDGVPSARTILLKRILPEGFVFFTNYNSQKSEELLENPNVHMLFYWKSTKKQIRVRGVIGKASDEISDEYWATREYDSNINSALSQQSSQIKDDFDYNKALAALKKEHPSSISRPENWGGFVINPQYFEFWKNGENRWHKREVFSLNDESDWESQLLYP